jgi:hypothetical protein
LAFEISRNSRKGQYALELLVSAVAFSLILASSISGWRDLEFKRFSYSSQQERFSAGSNALWQLTQSPGEPSDWENYALNESFPSALGLAKSPGELDAAKLNALVQLGSQDNYSLVKQKLGLYNRNFLLEVKAGNQTLYSFGAQLNDSSEKSVFSTFSSINSSSLVQVLLSVD